MNSLVQFYFFLTESAATVMGQESFEMNAQWQGILHAVAVPFTIKPLIGVSDIWGLLASSQVLPN
jgi:hypothetical protein